MKKLLMATLIVATLGTSAFAKEPSSNSYKAEKSFITEFAEASDVSWTTAGEFVKATFVYDNHRMEAFYTQEGEKIGTSRGIPLDLLPVKAKRAFAKKYDGYEIKESIAFEGVEENAYYISAENASESLIVKVYDNGETSVFKKVKK